MFFERTFKAYLKIYHTIIGFSDTILFFLFILSKGIIKISSPEVKSVGWGLNGSYKPPDPDRAKEVTIWHRYHIPLQLQSQGLRAVKHSHHLPLCIVQYYLP